MYLVDTSVWVGYLRGDAASRVQALKELLDGDPIVGIAPIILQEVLQGADSDERFEKWRRFFTRICCYPPKDPVDSCVEAARMYQSCRRAGKTPRSSNDCLIARIALEHELVLVHDDRDFDAIAAVFPALRIYPGR